MSYELQPTERDQCVFVIYGAEITADEAESARQEVNALLTTLGWNRVAVDISQLQSVPTALEIFDFAESLCLELPRSTRIALMVRLDQGRHGRLVKNIARNRGVILTLHLAEDNRPRVSFPDL